MYTVITSHDIHDAFNSQGIVDDDESMEVSLSDLELLLLLVKVLAASSSIINSSPTH